ncbi:MAG: endo-1,4-beta-xylanase, partial [Candidatus Brocadiae bacterium]|nr:endo-1,4-beta-xylanase [Candidatus Brocadiia bacterium]
MRRTAFGFLLLTFLSTGSAGEALIRAEDARIKEARIAGPSGDGAWRLSTDGSVGDWFDVPADGTVTITVSAAGRPAAGWPQAEVALRDQSGKRRVVKVFTVDSEDFRDYTCTATVAAGTHAIVVTFTNDYYNPAKKEDRDLVVRSLRVAGASRSEGSPMDKQIDARIRKHRTAQATLTLTAPDGTPLANTPVTVQMTRHKFLFGCNIFMLDRCATPEHNAEYGRLFRELLNFATLGFYWSSYEPEEGKTAFDRWQKVAQWCQRHGVTTKGHPLFWTHEAGWLPKKAPAEQEALQWARIEREIAAFKGLIDTWDVLNEPVVGASQAKKRNATNAFRLYTEHGAVWTVLRAFEHARKAGPKATLILNDYITSPAYEKIIQDSLAGGATIDVIGIQSHMHGRYWGAPRAWATCERFAKFGKPLHFTEATVVSGRRTKEGWNTTPEGEKRQAEQAAEFYRVLFSHPAMEAITWWDFSDQGAWQQAPAGLIRKDMTPKPAYTALKQLIKGKWWTGPLELTTDAKGQVSFRGFLGRYQVATPKGKASFALEA